MSFAEGIDDNESMKKQGIIHYSRVCMEYTCNSMQVFVMLQNCDIFFSSNSMYSFDGHLY